MREKPAEAGDLLSRLATDGGVAISRFRAESVAMRESKTPASVSAGAALPVTFPATLPSPDSLGIPGALAERKPSGTFLYLSPSTSADLSCRLYAPFWTRHRN